MKVIFIEYKKIKIATFFLICIIAFFLIFISSNFLKDKIKLTLTVNNSFKFSYPISYTLQNIYISEKLIEKSIVVNGNINKNSIKSYKAPDGSFSFSYPSIFKLNPVDFSGNEIIYHIDFTNKSDASHGFVQIWNLNNDLKTFLNNSLKTTNESISNFSQKNVTINSLPGYLWDYVVTTDDKNKIKALEVFLGKNNKLYRISYFIPLNKFNTKAEDQFWGIVNSFKLAKSP